jgi:antitoxin component YwqK of YwqJK toxin-antitoxin module
MQTCWRADGKEHGPQVELWPSGKRKSYSVYVDDVMRGPFATWDEDGRMTFHTFNNEHGRWIGTTTYWRAGKKDGPEIEHDRDGNTVKITSWVGGVALRTNDFACPAGTKKNVATGLTLTEDSLREDRTRITCERAGKPNGPYVDEYPGGTFEIVGTMANGKRTGAETGYYDTGEKFWVGKRANDKRVGTWATWYPPGHKVRETDYDARGMRTEERRYDDAGKVKDGTTYQNDEVQDVWVGPKGPGR